MQGLLIYEKPNETLHHGKGTETEIICYLSLFDESSKNLTNLNVNSHGRILFNWKHFLSIYLGKSNLRKLVILELQPVFTYSVLHNSFSE